MKPNFASRTVCVMFFLGFRGTELADTFNEGLGIFARNVRQIRPLEWN